MLPKALVGLAALISGTLAAPRNTTWSRRRALAKRAVPSFEPGAYSAEHMEQIDDGHWDAIMMAATVVDYADDRPPPDDDDPYWFDEIFKKYFNIDDMPTVIEVFRRIVDNDPSGDGEGNARLGNIKFVADYIDPRDGHDVACDPNEPTEAELRLFKTNNPKLVLCNEAFSYGVIGTKAYTGAPGVTCNMIYPRVSWRMETFGHNLLHEYTHWDKLLVDIFEGPFGIKGIEDVDTDETVAGPYGCWAVRQLDRPQSQRNADSYAWLASEVWWTQTCFGTHGPLLEPRKEDNAP